MNTAVLLIKDLGFPIFVALWLLIRLEKRLDRMTELQTSHMQATAVLAKSMERLVSEIERRHDETARLRLVDDKSADTGGVPR